VCWWSGCLWVAFQMWYASPIPFSLPSRFRFGLFNDTEARSIHLALGCSRFPGVPAFKRSPRDYVPGRTGCSPWPARRTALYLIVFYKELSLRPGQPDRARCRGRHFGVLLLLEATRRALACDGDSGGAVPRYVMAGPMLPDVVAQ